LFSSRIAGRLFVALKEASLSKSVLIVSGEGSHREALASKISDCGLLPRTSASADAAGDLLATGNYAVVVCEDTLPDGDFRLVMTQVDRHASGTPVIVVSRRADWESYMIALAGGATDYVAFPPYPGEIEHSLKNALELSHSLAAIKPQSAVLTRL
jgi:DNA-binding NtrC family response regulator